MTTPPIPQQLQPGTRCSREFSFAVKREAIDVDARTVELAFSSEIHGERSWGIEVLDHGANSIRLGRLMSGGPLLMDHDTRDLVGVIEQVQIGADRVGRAVVRFGRSARASEVFNDVVDGIRRNVSVGYVIHEVQLESERDGVPVYRVTDWEPYEASLVSVPLDPTVGVGRDAATPSSIPEIKIMSEQTPAAPADHTPHIRAGADGERKRVADIMAIGEQYRKYGVDEIAATAIRNGDTVDQFRAAAMDKMASAPKPTADIGLSDSETRSYSLLRALNALANPGDRSAQAAAGFEIECSLAAAQKRGKSSSGLFVPHEVLQRDLTKGTTTAGGHTVATDLLAGSFIDLLRNAMVINGMGTQFLTGLVGDIAIPKHAGAATAYWVTESGAPTESQQTFGQVTMSPKTVGAFTDISRKLILQSSIGVEAFVQRDLATVLAQAIQSAAILGGGTNEPTGILSTSGIGDVAGGTNGLAPTWAHIVALETAVAVANADVGTLGYLTNAKVRGRLKGTEKFSAGTGAPVWAEGNTPLNGYRAGVTNAVPSNLTKGTASGIASAIIFGNFADLLIGMWGGLELTVDPYTGATSGTVRVVALQDVDVAVRHALSFSAMKDALTT
jgi:HK97 family phage major capsid protein